MRRRRRWFTLEGKVNSSCCFKSLGKPRPQRELDRAPYRNVSQSRDISEPGELTQSSFSSSSPSMVATQRLRLF